MSTYFERGHSLTTKRGKNTYMSEEHIRRSLEPTPWTPIIEWQKKNIKNFPSNAEFNTWWKEVMADFQTGTEEVAPEVFISTHDADGILEYLNQTLIIETPPSFSQKVNNYVKFLESKKSEFPGKKRMMK